MLEYKDNKNPKKLEIDDLEKIIIINLTTTRMNM